MGGRVGADGWVFVRLLFLWVLGVSLDSSDAGCDLDLPSSEFYIPAPSPVLIATCAMNTHEHWTAPPPVTLALAVTKFEYGLSASSMVSVIKAGQLEGCTALLRSSLVESLHFRRVWL